MWNIGSWWRHKKGPAKGFCWVCLEEEPIDDSWLLHTCQCNLQVHKKCYFRWLYNRNFDLSQKVFTALLRQNVGTNVDQYRNIIDEEIRREIKRSFYCYFDGHRDFHKPTSIPLLILTNPILHKIFLPFLPSYYKNLSSHDDGVMVVNYLNRLPPIKSGPCPQCKLDPFIENVEYKSKSWLLEAVYRSRETLRVAAVLSFPFFTPFNICKWWLKLALWELRCFFPESILKKLLDVGTTSAIDVYLKSMPGIMSIPQRASSILAIFPIYIFELLNPYNSPSIAFYTWPIMAYMNLSLYNFMNNDPVPMCMLSLKLFFIVYRVYFSKIVSNYYKKMLNQIYVSFYNSDEVVYQILDENINNEDILIKDEIYEHCITALTIPLASKWLGHGILRIYFYLRDKFKVNFIPKCSLDDMKAISTMIGFGLSFVGQKLFHIYLTKLRIKEIEELKIESDKLEIDKLQAY